MSAARELTPKEKFRQRADAAARKLRQALIDASLDAELAGKPPIQIPPQLANDIADGKPQMIVTRTHGEVGDVVSARRVGGYVTASRLSVRTAVMALDAARKPGEPAIMEKLTGVLTVLAEDGDVAAARVLTERLDPPPVGRGIKLAITKNMSVEEKLAVLEKAVSDGEVTPSEGVQVAQIFLRQVELSELREIRGQLDEMKRAISGRG
jgi:hypothetical protein